MLEIDGEYGEGGGQILRTALSLSCITGKPFRIRNIRARRSKPGLRPQHLACVFAAKAICDATVEGAAVGSTALAFSPGELRGGKYFFDVAARQGSAGSTSLVFQTILLPLALADESSSVTLEGGTHVPWSPPYHYLEGVFLPTVREMSVHANARLERWGWYPIGKGVVRFEIEPVSSIVPILRCERLEGECVEAVSATSNLPSHIGPRQKKRILKRLSEAGLEVACDVVEAPAVGEGTFVFARIGAGAFRAGFSGLGSKGRRAEEVADGVADELCSFLGTGAAVDEHLADQLVPYMGIANGKSTILASRITSHLLTNIWVVERFATCRFEVQGVEGETGVISCHPGM